MKIQRPRYISMFAKSVISLLAVGLLPLLILGYATYATYANTARDTILANLSQSTRYVSKAATNLVTDLDTCFRGFYAYQATEYDYLYQLMQDSTILEQNRNDAIIGLLSSIRTQNPAILRILFITPDERQYLLDSTLDVAADSEVLALWHGRYYEKESKSMRMIATHSTEFSRNDNNMVLSATKNVFDTQSVASAKEQLLGTAYFDVSLDSLEEAIQAMDLPEHCEGYLVDRKQMVYIYHPDDSMLGEVTAEFSSLLDEMKTNEFYIKSDDAYWIYSAVEGTSWLIIIKAPTKYLDASIRGLQNTVFFIILLCVALLSMIYFLYARTMSRPIRIITRTMKEVQTGNFNVRVPLHSNDEIGVLASGLNEMLEHLQDYINQVFVAKIKQRDARIEKLSMQIQPHYLYNTLDVIRMSALTSDDEITAQMIDSLSAQLRYLLSNTQEFVPLQSEIANVRDYITLLCLRYERQITLEVHVSEELMRLTVPHLILQPTVENSIKHGLHDTFAEGVIAISARTIENKLEISVTDNGIGMSPEQFAAVRQSLSDRKPGTENTAHIGLANVQERIQLLYGSEYGISVSSYLHIGTVVKYHLPIMLKDKTDTQGGRIDV